MKFPLPVRDTREDPPRRVGFTTYLFSFLCMVASMVAAAWTGGDMVFYSFMAAAAAMGHATSARGWGRRVPLAILIYPLGLLAVWTMRAEVWGAVQGGSLLPLAKLLTIIQVLVSFNLRNLRTLYDTLILDLLVVLLASQGALSANYLAALSLFAVAAMFFLASASTNVGSLRRSNVSFGHSFLVLGSLACLIILVFGAALASFLILPQRYRAPGTVALPSRLDVTVGRPIAPSAPLTPSALADSSVFPSLASSAGETRNRSEATVRPDPRFSADAAGSSSGRSYAALGYVGDDDKDVVMRVRSPVASYWRGQVLEAYDGRGWSEGSLGSPILVDSRGNIRFRDTPPPAGTKGRYVQTFYLATSQPNAVFTGYSPGYIVAMDSGEDRRPAAPKGLQGAESYRVISSLPSTTPLDLRQDQADRSYRQALALPASVPTRVKELAVSVIAGAATDYDKAARLEQFLRGTYAYDLRVPPLSSTQDAADNFLFDRQSGYCAQFATAMAVMARTVGLPARIATGYVPGAYDSLTGVYTVRRQDAHAWVEIKFRNHGWVPFDPTPRPDVVDAFDVGYVTGAQDFQSLLRSGIKDALGAGSSGFAGTLRGVALHNPAQILGATATLAAVTFLLAGWLFFRRRRRKNAVRLDVYSRPNGHGRRDVMEAYTAALRTLARKGFPSRQPDQSPQEYVMDLTSQGFPVADAFRRLTKRATRALYGLDAQDASAGRESRSELAAIRALPRIPHAR